MNLNQLAHISIETFQAAQEFALHLLAREVIEDVLIIEPDVWVMNNGCIVFSWDVGFDDINDIEPYVEICIRDNSYSLDARLPDGREITVEDGADYTQALTDDIIEAIRL